MEKESMPCPYCGEVVLAAATLCRYCKSQLKSPPQIVAAQAPPKKSKTVMIVLLIVGAVLVVPCLLIGVAIVLPAVARAKRVAREATADHLIDNLTQAAKMYEMDWNAYPPGDGTGSDKLARVLSKPGPKKIPYFEFLPDMLDTRTSDIINPVHSDGSDELARIIHYRNNVASDGSQGAGPAVRFKGSFDMWCAGAGYFGGGASDPSSWAVNNWE